MAKLKICGLTCEADVAAVNEVKPDFAGFVIEVPGRRRSVTPEQVKVLVKGLDKEILSVGVFVNAAPELPISLLRDGTLWAAQLHGDDRKNPEYDWKARHQGLFHKNTRRCSAGSSKPCRLHPLRSGRRRNRRTFRLDPGSPSPSPILPCRRNRSRKPPQRHWNLTPMGCRPEQQPGNRWKKRPGENPADCPYAEAD